MKHVIDSETYEKHIRDEVHLYGLLHQLAFLAGKVKDADDMAVPSRFMRKFICRLRLSEVSRQ